ncbi:MAG: hypothetical protein RLZZ108_1038 [Actinomycetota bacterium]|jgi:hypothetical protein
MFAFGLLLQVCLASFQNAQLTYLAYRLAEYASLADSTSQEVEALFEEHAALMSGLSVSLEQSDQNGTELTVVRLGWPGPFGLHLGTEGIAVAEIQR